MQDPLSGIQPVQFSQESGHTHRGSKFQHACMLILCDPQSFSKTLLCGRDGWLGLFQQQFPFQPKQFRLPTAFSLGRYKFLRL